MLSSFRYFERKRLTLGSLSYLFVTALMCVLYITIDSPKLFVNNSNQQLSQHNDYSPYWVTYELSNDVTAHDIASQLQYVLTNTDMENVNFKLECDEKNCFVGFASKDSNSQAAFKALGVLRSL